MVVLPVARSINDRLLFIGSTCGGVAQNICTRSGIRTKELIGTRTNEPNIKASRPGTQKPLYEFK